MRRAVVSYFQSPQNKQVINHPPYYPPPSIISYKQQSWWFHRSCNCCSCSLKFILIGVWGCTLLVVGCFLPMYQSLSVTATTTTTTATTTTTHPLGHVDDSLGRMTTQLQLIDPTFSIDPSNTTHAKDTHEQQRRRRPSNHTLRDNTRLTYATKTFRRTSSDSTGSSSTSSSGRRRTSQPQQHKRSRGSSHGLSGRNATATTTIVEESTVSTHVGKEGSAVQYAKEFGLPQRQRGIDPIYWDALETFACWDNDPIKSKQQQLLQQQQQLPHAILIGVQKCGTTALYRYLHQHPQIIHGQKELYFLDERMDMLLTKIYDDQAKHNRRPGQTTTTTATMSNNSTLVRIPRNYARQVYHDYLQRGIAREEFLLKQKIEKEEQARLLNESFGHRLYRSIFATRKRQGQKHDLVQTNGSPKSLNDTHTNASILLDMTPNYIFHSNRVPQRITCLVPWVKLLVLLRNPIDRAWSQYRMKVTFVNKDNPRWKDRIPSFHEYVQNDIRALYETGVLQNWTQVQFTDFAGSEQEWKAWRTYIQSGLNAPVGMGLYAIQLRHYLQQFQRSNKPIQDLLVIPSERLQRHTQQTFEAVVDFLGLPRINLTTDKIPVPKAKSNQTNTKQPIPELSEHMKPETRAMLQEIFEPYNRLLAQLLGPEWEHIWPEL